MYENKVQHSETYRSPLNLLCLPCWSCRIMFRMFIISASKKPKSSILNWAFLLSSQSKGDVKVLQQSRKAAQMGEEKLLHYDLMTSKNMSFTSDHKNRKENYQICIFFFEQFYQHKRDIKVVFYPNDFIQTHEK